MILHLFFHMMTSILFGYAIFYNLKYIQFPESEFQWHHKFGGKFKFLSVQNMFVQFIYFFLAFFRDVASGCVDVETIKSLNMFIDNFFAGLAFPLAIFVTLNFWVLYFTKREQILPTAVAGAIPHSYLHVLYTSGCVCVLLDMCVTFREYPEFCSGLVTILTYMSTYILWLHCIKYFAGFWVYPLLNNKNPKELYTYFGSSLLQTVIIYMLGEILHNSLWSYELIHKNCVKK